MGRNGHALGAAHRIRVGVFVVLLLGSALAVVPFQPAGARQPGKGEILRRSTATQPAAAAATVPSGFQDEIAFSGFTLPTALSFAPNGRVYVAEKSGLIKVFTNTSDTTPSTVADLRARWCMTSGTGGCWAWRWDPQLGTSRPQLSVRALHLRRGAGADRAAVERRLPGVAECPGATTDGCVVQGRLSRLPVDPTTGVATGPEQVLIGPDWCQQYPSHSIGQLAFGQDGALYVSSGDGQLNFADWGQAGGTVINPSTGQPYTVANPCNDPPNYLGSQHLPQRPRRRAALPELAAPRRRADPCLDGAHPAPGPGHRQRPSPTTRWPPAATPTPRRCGLTGCATPSALTIRPGTNEVWVGDVGWGTWEEIERIARRPPQAVRNFGWPCYEGNAQQYRLRRPRPVPRACTRMGPTRRPRPTTPTTTARRSRSGDTCRTGGSSISGMAFYAGGSRHLPLSSPHGALFFERPLAQTASG